MNDHGIDSIWVFAEATTASRPRPRSSCSPRRASSATRRGAFVGGDADAVAATLGEYGATKVYATGDLGGALPGVAGAAAMQGVIVGGERPT